MTKVQYWVQKKGIKVVVIFEGRDTSGKGGVIKRMTKYLSPRFYKIVALPVPTKRELGEWYF